ncbi:MAG: hypothetical protein GF331_03555 [Chitinivibrionales bacterium]|nr:hypothetical protein [Chitinivibrionales bacterium]
MLSDVLCDGAWVLLLHLLVDDVFRLVGRFFGLLGSLLGLLGGFLGSLSGLKRILRRPIGSLGILLRTGAVHTGILVCTIGTCAWHQRSATIQRETDSGHARECLRRLE